MICSFLPISKIPSFLDIVTLFDTHLSIHFVIFSPTLRNIKGFSILYLTGTSPKSMLSVYSNLTLHPIPRMGTTNFSLSVITTKS